MSHFIYSLTIIAVIKIFSFTQMFLSLNMPLFLIRLLFAAALLLMNFLNIFFVYKWIYNINPLPVSISLMSEKGSILTLKIIVV